jgi:hypothetical protein
VLEALLQRAFLFVEQTAPTRYFLQLPQQVAVAEVHKLEVVVLVMEPTVVQAAVLVGTALEILQVVQERVDKVTLEEV